EERQSAILRPVEQPGGDAAAHASSLDRLAVGGRQPVRVSEQLGEGWSQLLKSRARRRDTERSFHLFNQMAELWCIKMKFITHSQSLLIPGRKLTQRRQGAKKPLALLLCALASLRELSSSRLEPGRELFPEFGHLGGDDRLAVPLPGVVAEVTLVVA